MKKFLFIMLIGIVSFAFAEEKGNTVKLSVNGMTCSSCASTVEKALKGVSGVSNATVDLKSKSAIVVLASNSKTTHDELVKAVADAGFSASESKSEAKTKTMKQADDCDGGGCGDDCDTSSKEMKTKKSKSKAATKKS